MEEKEKNGCHCGKFLKGLFVGGLLGALAGILNAPKSGKELRSDLKQRSDEALEKAKAILDDAKYHADELKKEANRHLSEAKAKAREILRSAEQKASEAKESVGTEAKRASHSEDEKLS